MPRRPLLIITLLLPFLLLLTACESKVTLDNYNLVTEGMSVGEVEGILGRGTEESPSTGVSLSAGGLMSGSAATPDRVFIWKDENRQIIVTFADGKVVTKQQTGL